ncbi:MAG: PrsW family glutamic-type intramembrane protease [Alkalispirochaeta sp.]
MTVGRLIVNVLLIATVPTVVLVLYHQTRATVRQGVAVGALAAVLVVAALLVIRRSNAISPETMTIVVVLAEEAAKALAVLVLLSPRTSTQPTAVTNRRSSHPHPPATGWSVGAGFASAEHLLYATSAPRTVLVRILTAGIIHLVTARCYSGALTHHFVAGTARPTGRRTPRSGSGAPRRAQHPSTSRARNRVRLSATLAAGVLLHLSYNLLARRLDQIPVLW